MTGKSLLRLVLLAILILVTLAVVLIALTTIGRPPGQVVDEKPRGTEWSLRDRELARTFREIQNGMDESEVTARFGEPGEHASRVSGTYLKKWKGDNLVIRLGFSEHFGKKVDAGWIGMLECGWMSHDASALAEELRVDDHSYWSVRWWGLGGPWGNAWLPVIYDGIHPGWPWITTRMDGTLCCVWREGTVHGFSATGRIMLSTSADKGRTWAKARVIIDEPGVDDRNVAIVELANKDLLLTYNTYTKTLESLALTSRSRDGGKTWEKPRPVGVKNTRTRAAAVVLKDGSLLLPYYAAPGSGALAGLSKDNGQSWQTVRVPDAEGFIGDEWDTLEVKPGRIIGILRNSHRTTDGTFWKTESQNGGRTWSVPKRTNVQSKHHPSPPQLARHGDMPILIYADRRIISVSAVKTNDPDFLRWDVERRLPCYVYNADELPILDGSYPVSVQTGPGKCLIVDYEIRKNSKRITGYYVTFPKDW